MTRKSSVWLVIAILLAALDTGVMHAQSYVNRITVSEASGERRGFTEPLKSRPSSPIPNIFDTMIVFFYAHHDVKDEKGRIVSGLSFASWMEGEQAHVDVFDLVPRPGRPNAYLATDREGMTNLQLVRFISFPLKLGESRKLVEMKRFGLEPMIVTFIRAPRSR